ncbi:uncharacterized protein LOC128681328 [Plodia interpunctella]|uniref:uncharacterized protein LOC128681328 n=1 Tax=Plodia interpunctella TaxID=58824 RepID=UPI002368ADE5|nr:uncharacterized protein LOC128681328 [Plodia interpunctella]XP_053621089.1 uncharacterized protein LOC128681328 [Plodia interpunctella]XP_053621090.1 uncharacterized protein LOC128681328 [Plodia interpunctella]XP_053621091.1 uncharacterized protein LOC128681328 [Plodia interpunctella]XP_053621092.1 uncharacterized protein LOC128681328 [Plodia interpunctella]
MATIHRTISLGSLSSISEVSTNGKKKKKNKNVTVGFKSNWFENTLSFVKDDSRLSFNYGRLTPPQVNFIRDMLNFESDPSVKQEKYAPLYEALTIFELKFNFKLSMNNGKIMLLKVPKDKKYVQEPNLSKKIIIENEELVINRLSQRYMVEIAETIMDFIDDPTRVILQFDKVKPLESMFMHSVIRSPRPMFPQHAQIMQHLKDTKSKMDFKLQIVVGKVNRRTQERTVIFNKLPKFSRSFRKSRDSSLKNPNSSADNNLSKFKTFFPSSSPSSAQNENNSMETEHNPPQETENSTQCESMQTELNSMSKESVQTELNSINKKSKQTELHSTPNKQNSTPILNTKLSKPVEENDTQMPIYVDSVRSVDENGSVSSGGSDQSASSSQRKESSALTRPLGGVYGSQTNVNIGSTSVINKRSVFREGLDARKTKLLEAMSIPVQMNNAERMMQKMGWDGGPLGRRGVGITEPIIPALDLVSGAGLGHVAELKLPKQPQPQKPTQPQPQPQKHTQPQPQLQKFTQPQPQPQKPTQPQPQLQNFTQPQPQPQKPTQPQPQPQKQPTQPQPQLQNFTQPQPQPQKPTQPQPQLQKFTQSTQLTQHPKTQKKLKSESVFRIGLLQALLDLIQSDRYSVELKYANMIGKKCINFVRNTIVSFSERRPISLNDQKENSVARKVIEALRNHSDILVYGAVSDCKKRISLKKGKIAVPHTRTIEKFYKDDLFEQSKSANIQKITSDHLQRLAETIKEHRDRLPNEKQYIGFRITVLYEILHLLKTNDMSKKLVFDSVLSVQYLNYIVRAVERLNIGKRPYVCAQILEQDTVDEILRNMKDIILVINFDTNKASMSIEKLLPYQVGDYNTLVLKASSSLTFNKNNKYEHIPHTNLIYSYNVNDCVVIDLTKDGVNNNSDDVNNKNSNVKEVTTENNSENNTQDKTQNKKNCSNDKNGASVEDYKSEDDDVILIERELLTIVISDDELTEADDNAESTLNTDKLGENDNIETKITNEGNVEIDESKTKGESKSSHENAESIDILDTDLGSVDTFENQCTEIDTARSLDSIEFKTLNGDIVNHETSDESIHNNKETTDKGNEESNDIENCDEPIGIVMKEQSTDVNLSENLNQELVVSATDINKETVKVAKKEKPSYSEEFDNDLYDLAMVLDLDDDIFDYCVAKKEPENIDRPMSKRSRSDSEQSSPDNTKKTKVFTFSKLKKLSVVPKDYPEVELKKECAINIQTILSNAIDNCKELPLLECHGIQNGGLVYSCHDEQSFFFIQNCLSVASDYKIINNVVLKKKVHIMTLKFNSLLDDIRKLFNRLELYNAGLITDSWHVKNVHKFDDYMLISVELDDYSYKYICDNNFRLYAGIDEVRFTIVWD